MKSHFPHLEDLIYLEPASIGLGRVISIIKEICNGSTNYEFSLKIDGSPAFVVGSDSQSRYFVGTKNGFLSKSNHRVFYQREHIENRDFFNSFYGDDMRKILLHIYDNCKGFIIPKSTVIMGDFLYHIDDVRIQRLRGTNLLYFKPNILTYVLPINRFDPKVIPMLSSAIGVSFHTEFTQTDGGWELSKDRYFLDNLVKSTPDCFVLNRQIYTGFSITDLRQHLEPSIATMEYILFKIRNFLSQDLHKGFSKQIFAYMHSLAKKGENFNNRTGVYHTLGLYNYIEDSFNNSKITAAFYIQAKNFINKHSSNLASMFSAIGDAILIKEILIDALINPNNMTVGAYLPDGSWGHEGLCVYDKTQKDTIKLVKRDKFTYHLFKEKKYEK